MLALDTLAHLFNSAAHSPHRAASTLAIARADGREWRFTGA
jgi:hypothetical protein